MAAQELDQAVRPMLAGLDNIEEIGEDHKCVVDRTGVGMKLCEQRSGLFSGQGEGHGEAAVPESRVMRAGIANNGQVMQEGAEDFFIEPVGIRDGLSVRRGGQIVIEGSDSWPRLITSQTIQTGGRAAPLPRCELKKSSVLRRISASMLERVF